MGVQWAAVPRVSTGDSSSNSSSVLLLLLRLVLHLLLRRQAGLSPQLKERQRHNLLLSLLFLLSPICVSDRSHLNRHSTAYHDRLAPLTVSLC